jgi:LysR family transcriptional regulator, transcriptional activator for bauABCD operon
MPHEAKSQITLDGIDVNLLRMFCVIVESNGFSAAQARMNISAASISSKMAALEDRLGLRLCQRGRAGFSLTSEGQKVYESATAIFKSHVAFVREVNQLREELTGRLDIGIVDSTVTNPDMRLSDLVRRFSLKHPHVHLALHVMEPPHIERALLESKLQIGISAFYHHVPGLQYRPLLEELHQLYCARGHALFDRAPDRIEMEELRDCRYVIRSHLPSHVELAGDSMTGGATVTDMEAMAHLVLSGQFIGFMPVHYAAVWTGSDRMRPILPGRFTHKSTFEIAINSEHRMDRATVAFLQQIRP